MKKAIVLLLFMALTVLAKGTSYRGDKVFVVKNDTEALFESIDKLGLDVWGRHGEGFSVRVPAASVPAFRQVWPSSVEAISDVQELVDAEARSMLLASETGDFFATYQRYDAIVQKMEDIAGGSDGIARVVDIGKTHEGRVIKGLFIGEEADKKTIVYIGGQHAREWISPATVMYIADRLVAEYPSVADVAATIDAFQFLIIPVVNADGYEFSHTSTRMWRKTREENRGCFGTDPNRNWDYMWNRGGSSNNPCSDIYHGTAPFSAACVRAVADYVGQFDGDIASFIDFHAFGQLALYPWGYTCSERAPDYQEMDALARVAAKAIQDTHGKSYRVGDSCNTIYQTSGGADDWTYGALGVVYSYCFEGRDTGANGFLLPPAEIVPSGVENYRAVLAMAAELADKF